MSDILRLTPYGDRYWKLCNNFHIETKHLSMDIYSDFVTDLASVPRIFWSILPPFGNYSIPAVVHDALYKTHKSSRREADEVFLELMERYNVKPCKRSIMFLAVRIFGGLYW